MTDAPEPDRLPDAPHPKQTRHLYGHDAAVETLLSALNDDRMHHAWMITGPMGIGKATLAYQAAAAVLGKPEDGGMFGAADPLTRLALAPDHPIMARILAGSEPGLFVLRRPLDEKTERLKQVIPVDEVRRLRNFFAMSAGGNGRRVVIVDAVDDLNTQAANALLKMLEEPPAGAVMFLVTHRPGAVLPTIRSRCRVLALDPLSPDHLQAAFAQATPGSSFNPGLAVLAQGSVGRTITLANQGGLDIYEALVDLHQKAPSLDRAALFQLADAASARGNDGGMDRLADMIDLFLSRLARSSIAPGDGVQVCSGERDLFARLNPSLQTARDWADHQQQISAGLRSGLAVNLDPTALVLDMALKTEALASRTMR